MEIHTTSTTRIDWARVYNGKFSDYILEEVPRRYGALCPDHVQTARNHRMSSIALRCEDILVHRFHLPFWEECQAMLCMNCDTHCADQMIIHATSATEDCFNSPDCLDFPSYCTSDGTRTYRALCPECKGYWSKHGMLLPSLSCNDLPRSMSDVLELWPRELVEHEPSWHLGLHLWNEHDHREFTFVCRDGAVKVHRAVLLSSPVLKAMMHGSFQEAGANEISLPDADAFDIECLWQFVYTSEMSKAANLPALLRLADMYQLDALVLQCCAEMLARLCPDNVTSFVRALRAFTFESEPMSSTFKIISELVRRDSSMCSAVLHSL